MTDTTPHRATPAQWADVESWAAEGLSCYSSILELRSRLEALEAGATCPHVVTGAEGTSYCALAEQQAAAPSGPAPAESLVEVVRQAILRHGDGLTYSDEARAAIRTVAEWINNRGQHMAATILLKEVKR